VRGTGLGLYISKQMVEAMDGRIWVESSGIAGLGSRFCFTLPAAPSLSIKKKAATTIPLPHLDHEIAQNGHESILIAPNAHSETLPPVIVEE